MDKLHILWTNADEETGVNMVFMYGINSIKKKWWDEVTIIIWGATAEMAAKSPRIIEQIKAAQEAGVHISACKACAENLGVAGELLDQGIEVIYWGQGLTEILKKDYKLLTI